jgi:hypothetical protein
LPKRRIIVTLAEVRSQWKKVMVTGTMVLLLAVLTGCSGFSATRSISPASLLLPGLLQADPLPSLPSDGTLPAVPANTDLAGS